MNQTKSNPKAILWRARVTAFLRDAGSRNLWLSLGLLAAGLITTALASLYIKAEVEAAAQREFDFICNEIQLNITDRLSDNAQVLYSSAALFDASETVTRLEWRAFTEQLHIEQQLPGTQGVGFALLITPEQLDQHIQEIRFEGFPDYTVQPAGEREIYSSIIYIEPFSGRNLRAFGYDMLSEPIRRAAMEKARDENRAVLSGKVILVQETEENIQAGALMYVPVYRHGFPIDTIKQRRTALQGWVYSPYRMADLMHGTLRGWDVKQKDRQIYLQVYDGDVISPDTLLYDSQNVNDKALVSTALVSKLTQVDFAGHRWTLLFTQMGGLASSADYKSVWLVLFGGTSINLLLFGLTISLLRTRINARLIADQLTIELRESEEKYRTVANFTYDWESWRGPDGTYLYTSPACERISGHTAAEFLANPDLMLQITHPDDQPKVSEHAHSANHEAQKENLEIDFRIITPGGKTRWISHSCTSVYGEGGQWRGRRESNRDISERKQAEASIATLALRNQTLLHTASDGIHIIDDQGYVIEANATFCSMLGYTREEVLQLNVADWDMQWPNEELLAKIGELITHPAIFETKHRRKDGIIRDVEINAIGVTLEGRSHLYASARDITERKRMEENLKQSENLLRLVADNLPAYVAYVSASDLHYQFVNKKYPTSFHLTREQIIGQYVGDVLSQSNFEFARPYIDRALNGQACSYENTFLMADGRRWIQVNFVPELDLMGKVNGIVILNYDLTERKQMEEILRENEERYHTVVSNAPMIIFVTDEKGVFTLSEGKGLEKLGLQPSQVVGLSVFDVYRDYPSICDAMTEALSGHSQRYEITLRDIVFDVLFSPMFDQHGKVVKVIGVSNDITERKQVEDELRRAKDALEQALSREQTLSHTDALTGINNRISLFELAELEIEVAMRYQLPLAVIMYDIDHFKQVNDTFGHAAGDQILQHVTQSACAELRSADIIGRYGGEEFVIVLPMTNARQAYPLAERIRTGVDALRVSTEKGDIAVTLSIGIVEIKHKSPAETAEDIIRRADDAMYSAKQTGRNRTVISDDHK